MNAQFSLTAMTAVAVTGETTLMPFCPAPQREFTRVRRCLHSPG